MLTAVQTEAVFSLIYKVGEYIRTERTRFNASAVENKDVHDLVSYVDKNSEKLLSDQLVKILPGSYCRGEEFGEGDRSAGDFCWVIDPLDGTTNFIHNIPHYCISVGLQHKEETIAGWVYEVAGDRMFYASEGNGAFLNGKAIGVSNNSELSKCLIGTGFPVRKYDKLDEYLEVLKWMIENTRGVRRLGTAAYDLCLVASGVLDAFYETGLSIWDVCAGALIVKESGGSVSDFSGGKEYLEGRQIVATNGKIHDPVRAVIASKMISSF